MEIVNTNVPVSELNFRRSYIINAGAHNNFGARQTIVNSILKTRSSVSRSYRNAFRIQRKIKDGRKGNSGRKSKFDDEVVDAIEGILIENGVTSMKEVNK